jgi:hypothetical protein
LILSSISVLAQSTDKSASPSAVAPSGTELPRVVDPSTTQTASPKYQLSMKWNERNTNVLTVPFKNDTGKSLFCYGVQATRGIYIGDYPTRLQPGQQDNIAFFYDAADNTEGDQDLIRLLTDQGVKEIVVKVSRDAVVQYDTRRLVWSIGDAPEAKSITITITGGVTMPKAVRAAKGCTATLDFSHRGEYRVTLKPDSTAEPQLFPVFIDFDPALPGGSVVVTGVVAKKQ